MTQGNQQKVKKAPLSRKQIQKAAAKKKIVKKGAPLQLPKHGKFRSVALEERLVFICIEIRHIS